MIIPWWVIHLYSFFAPVFAAAVFAAAAAVFAAAALGCCFGGGGAGGAAGGAAGGGAGGGGGFGFAGLEIRKLEKSLHVGLPATDLFSMSYAQCIVYLSKLSTFGRYIYIYTGIWVYDGICKLTLGLPRTSSLSPPILTAILPRRYIPKPFWGSTWASLGQQGIITIS